MQYLEFREVQAFENRSHWCAVSGVHCLPQVKFWDSAFELQSGHECIPTFSLVFLLSCVLIGLAMNQIPPEDSNQISTNKILKDVSALLICDAESPGICFLTFLNNIPLSSVTVETSK